MPVHNIVLLIYMIVVIAVFSGIIGWGLAVNRHDNEQHKLRRQKARVEQQIEGIRAANRLNVAFWQAKEQMDAEAKRRPRARRR